MSNEDGNKAQLAMDIESLMRLTNMVLNDKDKTTETQKEDVG